MGRHDESREKILDELAKAENRMLRFEELVKRSDRARATVWGHLQKLQDENRVKRIVDIDTLAVYYQSLEPEDIIQDRLFRDKIENLTPIQRLQHEVLLLHEDLEKKSNGFKKIEDIDLELFLFEVRYRWFNLFGRVTNPKDLKKILELLTSETAKKRSAIMNSEEYKKEREKIMQVAEKGDLEYANKLAKKSKYKNVLESISEEMKALDEILKKYPPKKLRQLKKS